jgi:hypothetical protein
MPPTAAGKGVGNRPRTVRLQELDVGPTDPEDPPDRPEGGSALRQDLLRPEDASPGGARGL